MRYHFSFFLFLFSSWLGLFANDDVNDSIVNNIVKVYTSCQAYNYHVPWQSPGHGSQSGSGCILGDKIVTNAHVVAGQIFIEVRRANDAKKYLAEVLLIDPVCDLALLTVKDPDFFQGTVPITFGTLPYLGAEVAGYGFPIGGEELSWTKGVLSRIEMIDYPRNVTLLAAQIDAAINPGNSGGPIFSDGKLVGIAFQGIPGAQSIGYMIPTPVLTHFLDDYESGEYQGFPHSGIVFQTMENDQLKQYFGLHGKQTGVRVGEVLAGSPAENLLQPDDIILTIDGHAIADDGSIFFRGSERLSAGYLIQKKFVGESIRLTILRNKREETVDLLLSSPNSIKSLVPFIEENIPPSYYIFHGLVFQPLRQNYLLAWGDKWFWRSPNKYLYYLYHGKVSKEREEVVILNRVLPYQWNQGYTNYNDLVIRSVNGKAISRLKDLIDALENPEGDYHVILTEENEKIILHTKEIKQRHEQILKRYHLSTDRSFDLEEE